MGFINKNLLGAVVNGAVNNAVNGTVNGYSGGLVSYQNGKFYPTPGHPVATVANAAINVAQGGDPRAAAASVATSYLNSQGIPTDTTGLLNTAINSTGFGTGPLDAFGGIGAQIGSVPYDADEFAGLFEDSISPGFKGPAANLVGPKKYPLDLDTTHPTWMEIWSYRRTGVAVGNQHTEGTFKLNPVNGVSNICLPIPTGTGTAYGQSWDQADVSMMNELVAGSVGQVLSDANYTVGGPHSDQASSFSTSGVVESLKQRVSQGLGDQTLPTSALIAAGSVLGSAAVQGATGRAAFNNVLVNYSGPQFRTFEYSFSLKPQSTEEQDVINQMVRFLKIGQSPLLLNPGQLGRLYEIPLFFKIKYMSEAGEIRNMNKIGFCALQGISVKYGGDRFQTFIDNTPVQTDISLSFKEVQLLDRSAVESGY